MRLYQIIEARSPEHMKRAAIISGLGNAFFNIFKTAGSITVEIYDLDIFRNNLQSDGGPVTERAMARALQEAEVGHAMMNQRDNPTNIHIQLDRDYRGKGLGATLYEICLEIATAEGKAVMLSGARGDGISSEDAYRTWNHFLNNRQNIIAIPFDLYASRHDIKHQHEKYGIKFNEQQIAKNLLSGRVIRSFQDKRPQMGRFDPRSEAPIPTEIMDSLKQQYPAAFHVYQRNMYTIPQLQQAGKIVETNSRSELVQTALKLAKIPTPVRTQEAAFVDDEDYDY